MIEKTGINDWLGVFVDDILGKEIYGCAIFRGGDMQRVASEGLILTSSDIDRLNRGVDGIVRKLKETEVVRNVIRGNKATIGFPDIGEGGFFLVSQGTAWGAEGMLHVPVGLSFGVISGNLMAVFGKYHWTFRVSDKYSEMGRKNVVEATVSSFDFTRLFSKLKNFDICETEKAFAIAEIMKIKEIQDRISNSCFQKKSEMSLCSVLLSQVVDR